MKNADEDVSYFSSYDCVVIQKKTIFERYEIRSTNDTRISKSNRRKKNTERLHLDAEGLLSYQTAHDNHINSRLLLQNKLNSLGLKTLFLSIDDLANEKVPFFNPTYSQSHLGIKPKTKKIIALGGDGTLLHASHFVGNDCTLLGINSNPIHSVGQLCAFFPAQIETHLEAFFEEKLAFEKIPRLSIQFISEHLKKNLVPLALNDFLFCNKHPAATSRYKLTMKKNNEDIWSEKQTSSGVWISTASGSTAGIGSYGLPILPPHDPRTLIAVREPYVHATRPLIHQKFVYNPYETDLHLQCEMSQGLLCVDGADFTTPLTYGDEFFIHSEKSYELQVSRANTRMY